MVAEHLKDKPYELRWRFEFYEDLTKVANINGDVYDIQNLSEGDLKEIEADFGYLRSMDSFNECMGSRLSELVKEGVTYIDFVNEAYPNNDGNTYSFVQYWETSLGDVLLDYKGNDAPFSKEGLYQFTDDGLSCHTKVIENGRIYSDYITETFWDGKSNEEELPIAEFSKNHKSKIFEFMQNEILEQPLVTEDINRISQTNSVNDLVNEADTLKTRKKYETPVYNIIKNKDDKEL